MIDLHTLEASRDPALVIPALRDEEGNRARTARLPTGHALDVHYLEFLAEQPRYTSKDDVTLFPSLFFLSKKHLGLRSEQKAVILHGVLRW